MVLLCNTSRFADVKKALNSLRLFRRESSIPTFIVETVSAHACLIAILPAGKAGRGYLFSVIRKADYGIFFEWLRLVLDTEF